MTQPDDGPFALFGSDAYLPQYDDGPEWRAFYEGGALTERLVAEHDIEAYDWDNQALILTEGASRRFKDGLERTKECPRCFTSSSGALGRVAGAAQNWTAVRAS